MGQILSYKSSATIEYMNGNFSKITYMGPDGAKITVSFTASDLQNRNGVLPELVGKELGCLGFEHLYYAGLLGRSSSNLVKTSVTQTTKTPHKISTPALNTASKTATWYCATTIRPQVV